MRSTAKYLVVRACLRNRTGSPGSVPTNGRNYALRSVGDGFTVKWMTKRRIVCVIAVLCSCVLAIPARAQQQQAPEDPEDEKHLGLWLDQGISTGLSANKSLDVEFHERFDEGASNLFEYFVQGGVAFRLRPWFTLIPIYRYQRFPGNPTIAYENRLQLNLTLNTSRGLWRPTLRTLIEGRFPDNRPASARLRFRPGSRVHPTASHGVASGCWLSAMSSSSFPEATPSPTAAAATPKTAFRWGSDSPSAVPFPFGLTTYYSPLTCQVGGRQTKSLVSRSPLRSSAKRGEALLLTAIDGNSSRRRRGSGFPKKCECTTAYDCVCRNKVRRTSE